MTHFSMNFHAARLIWGLCVLLCLILPAHAQNEFVRRYAITTGGAMVMTGNTLGLSKVQGLLEPGTLDSIGVYTSIDPADAAPGWPQNVYGPTTTDYRQNGSTARMIMPSGSRVRYAELIWGGSLVTNGGFQTLTPADVNNSVTFSRVSDGSGAVTLASQSVTPSAATRIEIAGANNNQRQFYVRSAEVTSFVQQNGAGFYACGGVRSTLLRGENTANTAGWTLVVIYENDTMPTRNMTVFVGLSRVFNNVSEVNVVRGFCTAPFGSNNLRSRIAISALEGDVEKTFDQFRFGPSATLGTNRIISNGTANPPNNFFGGQINTGYDSSGQQNGTLDTSGTAGLRNHTTGSLGTPGSPGTVTVGGRQGYDITNVDVSSQMQPNQTAAYFQGTSSGDEYIMNSVALQIDVGAPRFPTNVKQVDKSVTFIGDTLTYTVTLDNSNGNADANNVIFYDDVPFGTSFIPGTFRLDNALVSGADPRTGVPVGSVPVGSTKQVAFQVRVNSIPTAPGAAEFRNFARWTYEFQSCSFVSSVFEQVSTNEVVTTVPRLEPTKSVVGPPNAPQVGQTLTWTLRVPNTGNAATSGATLVDPIPAGLQYVAGSTRLNGVLVPDAGLDMPYTSPNLINSVGEAAGVIPPNTAAVVTFDTLVLPGAGSRITNLARADADGNGPQPEQPFGASIPAIDADLGVTISDGIPAVVAGANNTYTVTVGNNGPQPVGSFNLSLTIPPAFQNVTITPSRGTYDSQTGDWNNAGSGDLSSGGSLTFTITGLVSASAIDPITLRARVSTPPGIADTNAANDTASDTDTIEISADLSVVKTDGRIGIRGGNTNSYTITVANLGPSTLSELTVKDVVPASLLTPVFTTSKGTYNSSTGQITSLNLARGEQLVVTLTAEVDMNASGIITNTATVSVPTGVTDPNSTNNSSTDQTAIGFGVSGTVYLDSNTNFQKESTEAGYNGQTPGGVLWAKLRRLGGGDAVAAVQVAADGTFSLISPDGDEFTLFLDSNGTLSDTTPSVPSGFLVTEAGGTPGVPEVEISVDSEVVNQNFGLFTGAFLSGTVFRDDGGIVAIPNNGQRESSEIGVGGVKIQLFSGNTSTLFAETFTDATGDYTLSAPVASLNQPVRIVKTNPADTLSTGAQTGTLPAGSTYDRNLDTISTTLTGQSYTEIDFGILPINTLTNDGAKVVPFGGSTLYTHVYTTQSSGDVTFSLVNQGNPTTTGWNAILYFDDNGNGQIDASDQPVSGSQTLARGQSVNLIVKVFAPSDGPLNATLDTRLNAVFDYTDASPALSATTSRGDVTKLSGQPGLELVKAVDKTSARSGDVIAYEITYRNIGSEPLSNIVVDDVTPAFTTFVDAGFDPLPLDLTACTMTRPAIGAKGAVKWTFTGTLAPGQSGIIRFRVTVE